MQVNINKKDEHLIFNKLKDGTSFLILFAASLLFIEAGVAAFLIPIRVLVPLKRIDITSAIKAGSVAAKYAQTHIMNLSSIMVQVIAYIFFICVIVAVCFKMFKVEAYNFKLKLGKNILMVFAFGMAIWFADVIVSRLYTIIGEDGTSMNQLMIYGALNSPVMWPTIILTIFLAPIVEEIIYRKFLIGTLHNKFRIPLWGAGLISAIVFALIHVSSSLTQLIYFPQYFVLAMVLVWAYIYSGQNIYFSIGVHIFNNAISIILWAISTLI